MTGPVCNESWTGAWGDHCIHPHGHDGSHMAADGHAWLNSRPAPASDPTTAREDGLCEHGADNPKFCWGCVPPRPGGQGVSEGRCSADLCWYTLPTVDGLIVAHSKAGTLDDCEGAGRPPLSTAVPLSDDEPTATRHAMRSPVRQAAEVLSDQELADALAAWYRAREIQVDGELRDEIARALSAKDGGSLMAASWTSYLPDADAVLALPAVRSLLADAAAIHRVRDVIAFLDESAEVHAEQGLVTAHYPIAQRLRRALDGGRP